MQVIAAYTHSSSLHNLEKEVKLVVEQFYDSDGIQWEIIGCLWHDLVASTWKLVWRKSILGPAQKTSYYHVHVCQFILYIYIPIGYFSLCVARTFSIALTNGIDSVTNDDLHSSFCNFLDAFESNTLWGCATGYDNGKLQ